MPWDVRLVNLQEVLDPIDVFRKLTGVRLQDVYNKMLRKGWTLGSGALIPPMQLIIRSRHAAQVRLLSRLWSSRKPHLVVSLVPHFNRAIYQGSKAAAPEAPFVTIPVDLADYPPHFWIEPGQDQFFIWSTDRGVRQTLSSGYPPDKVHRISGVILDPRFYESSSVEISSERHKLKLDPCHTTGLVSFGSQGSSDILSIVKRVNDLDLAIQLILICGHNKSLETKLRSITVNKLLHVVGFTSDMPYYMRLSDFFIGKPGPGSISEALAMGLPVIVERNAWTLPQERYNAEWIRERGVGVVLSSFREINAGLGELLDQDRLTRYRASVAGIGNHGVFETVDILNTIMEQ
jgi:1,2-diacylglycerol 3-beta-galactosyltransferase